MRRTLQFYFVLLIFFLFSSQIMGGSVLSSYGVGIPFAFPNARSMSMGGVAIAVPSQYAVSRLNPAGLQQIHKTTLSLQYFYEQNKYKDESGKATSQYANFDGFTFVLPVGKGLGFSASMSPYTRVDYYLSFQQEQSEELFIKSVQGNGGLNTFSFSMFFGITPKIALGLSGDYIFGKINEDWKVTYENTDFVSTSDLLSTKNNGYGFTAGILIHPISALQVGAIYRPKTDLDSKTDTYYNYTTNALVHRGSIKLPSSWGVGISYGIGQIGLIGLDFNKQSWSQLEINGQTVQQIRDTYRVALGTEVHPSEDAFDPYLKRMSYRFGICYQPFFVNDFDDQSIMEKWLTFGVGLPLLLNISQIDIALGFGQRGSLKKNGLSENLFRITLSVSGSEKWFIRRY